MITVKRVLPKEKKKVDAFIFKAWRQYNKEQKYIYKEKKFWFAAYDGKQIVGHIHGNTNGGVAYLNDIMINKRYRNKGIGKMLLTKFEEIAKNRKCHVCLLLTTDKHAAAIPFYQKNEYRIAASVPDMYWHVNEYYMIKRLTV